MNEGIEIGKIVIGESGSKLYRHEFMFSSSTQYPSVTGRLVFFTNELLPNLDAGTTLTLDMLKNIQNAYENGIPCDYSVIVSSDGCQRSRAILKPEKAGETITDYSMAVLTTTYESGSISGNYSVGATLVGYYIFSHKVEEL